MPLTIASSHFWTPPGIIWEEIFPNIQSEPPLAKLEAVSSCPIASYSGEETDSHLTATSFQVVVESNKISSEPPLVQGSKKKKRNLLPLGRLYNLCGNIWRYFPAAELYKHFINLEDILILKTTVFVLISNQSLQWLFPPNSKLYCSVIFYPH